MTPDPVRRRLGRRGASLLILGIIWVLSGVQDIVTHPHAIPGWWLWSHTPWQAQTAGWITTGAIACWGAFQQQGRDWIGWVAVYVMAFYAIVVYADAVIEAIGEQTFDQVALSGIRNVAFVGLILVLSGWREPVTFTGVQRGSQTGDKK